MRSLEQFEAATGTDVSAIEALEHAGEIASIASAHIDSLGQVFAYSNKLASRVRVVNEAGEYLAAHQLRSPYDSFAFDSSGVLWFLDADGVACADQSLVDAEARAPEEMDLNYCQETFWDRERILPIEKLAILQDDTITTTERPFALGYRNGRALLRMLGCSPQVYDRSRERVRSGYFSNVYMVTEFDIASDGSATSPRSFEVFTPEN